MAKLTRKELDDIVKRDVPGTRIVDTDTNADPRRIRAAADLDSPDLDALRAKYLGTPGSSPASTARASRDATPPSRRSRGRAAAPPADDDDVEIVSVAPERPVEPWDRGSRPKAVVVSSKEKRVIGRQG